MNKQATFIAFLIGIVTVLSINAKIDRGLEVDPIYYNSFDENVKDALQIGIEKFKGEYPKLNLSNDKFYVLFSEANGEKIIMISYLSCPNCGSKKLVESTNRFMKVSNRLMLPLIFDYDIKNSSVFASPNNDARISEIVKGYGITLDNENNVVDASFQDIKL